jgi:hypothetical protein
MLKNILFLSILLTFLVASAYSHPAQIANITMAVDDIVKVGAKYNN